MKKKILAVLIFVFIGIQFIRTTPEVKPYKASDDFINQTKAPIEIAKLLTTSCYDCHSNNTHTPWYGQIAPVSWWINHHIEEGREELNFSAWGTYKLKKKKHKHEEIIEYIEKRWMPMSSYLKLHEDAEYSDEEITQLVSWLSSIELEPKNPSKTLTLNNGNKWISNSETTAGIDRMITLINEDITKDSIAGYNSIGKKLNTEMKTIFAECTMKGEAHDQLHLYLVPLVKQFRELAEAETVGTAIEYQKSISAHLQKYADYFESE